MGVGLDSGKSWVWRVDSGEPSVGGWVVSHSPWAWGGWIAVSHGWMLGLDSAESKEWEVESFNSDEERFQLPHPHNRPPPPKGTSTSQGLLHAELRDDGPRKFVAIS